MAAARSERLSLVDAAPIGKNSRRVRRTRPSFLDRLTQRELTVPVAVRGRWRRIVGCSARFCAWLAWLWAAFLAMFFGKTPTSASWCQCMLRWLPRALEAAHQQIYIVGGTRETVNELLRLVPSGSPRAPNILVLTHDNTVSSSERPDRTTVRFLPESLRLLIVVDPGLICGATYLADSDQNGGLENKTFIVLPHRRARF